MTGLLAFILAHASRVTRITENRIRYWGTARVLSPSLAKGVNGSAFRRIYS